MHGPTAVRKRKTATATCTPATTPANSAKAGANSATGQEELYMYFATCICVHHVSWQSAEKEGNVHLQHQLLEIRTMRTQLDGKYCNRSYTKSTE